MHAAGSGALAAGVAAGVAVACAAGVAVACAAGGEALAESEAMGTAVGAADGAGLHAAIASQATVQIAANRTPRIAPSIYDRTRLRRPSFDASPDPVVSLGRGEFIHRCTRALPDRVGAKVAAAAAIFEAGSESRTGSPGALAARRRLSRARGRQGPSPRAGG